jgi:hypothetical protein
MKKTIKTESTELVFILDRSGSMGGLESDTVGGFNAMIEKQKKKEGTCFVTTVLFDSKSVMLHDRVPLERVPEMTERDYAVGGCTALLDALGGVVEHVENIHRYARAEDVPAHTVFVITTDGMENASRRFDSDTVKRMISRKQEEGWEFLFVAANIDAVETAARYGIRKERAVNYHADKEGTAVLYDTIGEAVEEIRSARPLGAEWSKKISEDYESRK